jgi:hypothetical protein
MWEIVLLYGYIIAGSSIGVNKKQKRALCKGSFRLGF